jgi:CRISPR/Cas system-associated exonuclease Cas4 (RecB family)
VRPEAEILTHAGHTLRPDRVIIREGQAVVVDYKTGKPMEKYKTQLEQYTKCLEDIGYKNVKKYLLYLEPEVRLEEV